MPRPVDPAIWGLHRRVPSLCTRSQSVAEGIATGPRASLDAQMVAGLAFFATAVATVFAQATGVRYSRTKAPHQGAWTFALALFALASAALI